MCDIAHRELLRARLREGARGRATYVETRRSAVEEARRRLPGAVAVEIRRLPVTQRSVVDTVWARRRADLSPLIVYTARANGAEMICPNWRGGHHDLNPELYAGDFLCLTTFGPTAGGRRGHSRGAEPHRGGACQTAPNGYLANSGR